MGIHMKKFIAVFIICMLCLAGCAGGSSQNKEEDAKKLSRIEIYSAQDELQVTVEDQTAIDHLLNDTDWSPVETLPDDLTPEYKLLVSQEKTLLAGQNPEEERDYELVETIIIFQDSSYAVQVISSDVVKNMMIPKDALTFYYELPESTIEQMKTLLD